MKIIKGQTHAKGLNISHPSVVGTIHSSASLAAALNLAPGDCDWLELRVDHFFPAHTAALRKKAARLAIPRIVTVRHPSEGGHAPAITTLQRRALYADFLEVAALVDLELRHAKTMGSVIRDAKTAGAHVILSFHDFRRTPDPAKLRALARQAADAGADIFKVAAMTHTAADLAKLIDFLAAEKPPLPLAVMGMGPFGKISRLVLAQAGSCLNYGYLGAPNASGQWPVALLKARIAELQEPDS
jgi:3-dehydroquinate dehydratase-1